MTSHAYQQSWRRQRSQSFAFCSSFYQHSCTVSMIHFILFTLLIYLLTNFRFLSDNCFSIGMGSKKSKRNDKFKNKSRSVCDNPSRRYAAVYQRISVQEQSEKHPGLPPEHQKMGRHRLQLLSGISPISCSLKLRVIQVSFSRLGVTEKCTKAEDGV